MSRQGHISLCITSAILILTLFGSAQTPPADSGVVTNADIQNMVQAKLGDDAIINTIKSSPSNFDISPDAVLKLKSLGTSDLVILAMRDASPTKAVMKETSIKVSTVPVSATDPNMLTNQSVVEMVGAKLPEEVIITKIQTSKANFDLSTPALVGLNNAGVSPNIVKAMLTPKTAPPVSVEVPKEVIPPDPNDPNAPHDPGIYAYTARSSGKKMILLEPTVYTSGKSGGVFASAMTSGIAKVKWKAVVRNPRANVRFSDPSAAFYFYFEEKSAGLSHSGFGTTTPNEFTLLRLEMKGDTRETVVMKMNAFGASSGTEDKANIAFTSTRMAAGVYKVVPNAPLKPGEYAFISASTTGAFMPGAASANRLFDFGVTPPE